MLLKRVWRTRIGHPLLALLVCGSCVSLPWRDETANETNVVFRFLDNQPLVEVTVGGRGGTFVVGSVPPVTLINREFASRLVRGDKTVVLGDRLMRKTKGETAELGTAFDGILGRDVWANDTLTVDYTRRLITIQNEPPSGDDLYTYRFRGGVPRVPIVIGGKQMTAIVDTASPDTVTLPASFRGGGRRTSVSIAVAGLRLSSVDAAVADVDEPVIGNRLLAHFVVAMSFRRGEIRLWRDPMRHGHR